MKIFISGKITGLPEKEVKEKFEKAEKYLRSQGCVPINPYKILGKTGLEYEEMMKICFSLIDVCDAVYFLKDFKESKGCMREMAYAGATNKLETREK